jgi:cyclic lactone autoinducer peptide
MKNNKTNFKSLALRFISKIAANEANRSANTSCVGFTYQPQLPNTIKKLRKF